MPSVDLPTESRKTKLPQLLLALMGLGLVAAPGLLSMRSAERTESCFPVQSPVQPWETARAAGLSDAVWARPDSARCTLQQYDMNSEQLRLLLEAISADANLAESFRADVRVLGSEVQLAALLDRLLEEPAR